MKKDYESNLAKKIVDNCVNSFQYIKTLPKTSAGRKEILIAVPILAFIVVILYIVPNLDKLRTLLPGTPTAQPKEMPSPPKSPLSDPEHSKPKPEPETYRKPKAIAEKNKLTNAKHSANSSVKDQQKPQQAQSVVEKELQEKDLLDDLKKAMHRYNYNDPDQQRVPLEIFSKILRTLSPKAISSLNKDLLKEAELYKSEDRYKEALYKYNALLKPYVE